MRGERKELVLLGSTGSIGTQTLDIVRAYPDRFVVKALTCGHNIDRLRAQIAEFRPALCVTAEEADAKMLAAEFPGVRFLSGQEGLIEAAETDQDLLVNALMGMRGLVPTYHAVQAGHDVALANKETLVAGGHVIMAAVREKGIRLLPIDSEHSAIWQCIRANPAEKPRRILLTASGGPFRGWTKDRLADVTPEMALAHPNWSMGRKITIDSATMMNKGFEMIEAKWLFDVAMEDITVLVHPQSIIHSAVEFCDSAVLAQLGVPDMRVPISIAIGAPERLELDVAPLDFFGKASTLTFEKPDTEVFDCLRIAQDATQTGGAAPAVMNAANEVLVQAFLDKKIGFTEIPAGIRRMLGEWDKSAGAQAEAPDLAEIVRIDRETRLRVEKELL